MLHRSCPDLRESKTACRRFRIPGTEFQFLSVQLGFWIPIIDEILDSLSCVLDSKRKIFPGIWIPLYGANSSLLPISQVNSRFCIPDSKRKIFPGIWIPLYGANSSLLPISQVNY